MRPHIIQPQTAAKPIGPYNHAVRVGDLLFCSGQIPLDKEGKIVEGGIKEQTRQVLQNVSAILEDQSLTAENVVKATVFMTDLNGIRGDEFDLRRILHPRPSGPVDRAGHSASARGQSGN